MIRNHSNFLIKGYLLVIFKLESMLVRLCRTIKNLRVKKKEVTLNLSKSRKQRDVWKSTYRDDGNKNANTTKHGIANGVSLFLGVADGLVRTVKPAPVRLYGASLNDQERQASYKGHKERGAGRERKTGRGREERKHKSTRSVTQT